MSDKRPNEYDPNYTYKKNIITVDNEADYPMLEVLNNAGLYPESIKNNLDMDQFKPLEL
ncbi:hypothetical protein [Clostridium sp.]|uniref:hypothetical protein n=1 Tax=Clostridium sp. TaxID=1506 RepID=UPI003D6D52A7